MLISKNKYESRGCKHAHFQKIRDMRLKNNTSGKGYVKIIEDFAANLARIRRARDRETERLKWQELEDEKEDKVRIEREHAEARERDLRAEGVEIMSELAERKRR